MKLKTYIIDAFTDTRFKGNPAGVCLVEDKLSDDIMLNIAAELNFSETAFIQERDEKGTFNIRYFSPKMEIPLCGHATLASAKVLFEKKELNQAVFITIENTMLSVRRFGHQVEMEFPVYETAPALVPEAMLDALGLNCFRNCAFNKETNILIIEVDKPIIVKQLNPDFEKLVRSHDSIGGVIVMSRGNDEDYDYCYRHFWPWNGTNEDPVTGAVHTFLGPYWASRLGRKNFKVFQPSERTGFMEVELLKNNKVIVRGEAVCLLEGELYLEQL